MNVVVNGLMTNYLKAGTGRKVLVCLHGWGTDSTNFNSLAEKLKNKYTFLIPDLPGFGATQEPPKAWGVDEYANFVASWLAKIGQKDVHGLIGHSNGGAIAIALVGDKKLSSKKLILIASSGIRDIYKLRRTILSSGAKVAKLPLKLLPKDTQHRLKRRAYEAIGSDYMLLPELDLSFRRLISKDMQATATKIKSPTLLIYGSADNSTPLKYGQLFNDAIKGSRLEVVDGGGHFLHQQNVDAVAELVGDFLE